MKLPVAALFFSSGLRVPAPRLLPLTIVAMAALLGVKSVALVRAAAPAGAATPMPAATTEQPPDAKSADAKPAEGRPAGGNPAAGKPGEPAAAMAAAAPAAAPAAGTAAAPADAGPPISESERALLLDLRKRRDELDAREAALAARESVLGATEARLGARVVELGSLQKRLEALEAERKERQEANWQGLVKLYESMKPKDAATIFNDLDLPVLLPIVDRMKDRKAAQVLAAMLPDRARLVTTELAAMRARANAVPPQIPAAGAAATPPGKTAGGT